MWFRQSAADLNRSAGLRFVIFIHCGAPKGAWAFSTKITKLAEIRFPFNPNNRFRVAAETHHQRALTPDQAGLKTMGTDSLPAIIAVHVAWALGPA